jgi:hypothetical protein
LIEKSTNIMKRARIMLAAIAVLGLVGGTLAFKAHQRLDTTGFYTTTVLNNKVVCTPAFVTTAPNATAINVYSGLTTVAGGPTYFETIDNTSYFCPTTTIQEFQGLGE